MGSMRREAHCTARAMRFLFFWSGRKRLCKYGRLGRVVPVDEGTRVCGERSTTPSRWKVGSCPGAWCSSTKEQGFAGREAPRRIGGRPVRARGRGARRRRNKGLRGGKHHAEPVEGRFVPGGVVLVDEGTRVCGEGSTTPDWRKAGSCPGAWCPSTKEQGFAGREAPRRIGGRPVRTRNRPAPPPDGIKKRSCYSSSATL